MNFETIPVDLKIQVLKYLPFNDKVNVWKSSKNLYNLSTFEVVWRYVNEELVGKAINIDSWMNHLNFESHREFYENVVNTAVLFHGIHSGDTYPGGKIHRWELDINRPQAVGYFVDPSNDFRASERYLESLANLNRGYFYSDVGCILRNNVDIEVSAGVVLDEEDRKKMDLLAVFTPSDKLSPVKAFDIENDEHKQISISIEKLNVESVQESEDSKFSHPSKHLLPFVDSNEKGYIYVVNFGKIYQCWPDDKALRSFKVKNFGDNKDSIEGIYASQHIGRSLKLSGGKISNENGSPVMQFTRITGDPLVPRGRVLVTGYLDKEEKNDSVGLDDNDEGRESSDDNLPWPFPSSTRPIGKTCTGEGQRAFVDVQGKKSFEKPYLLPITVNIENPQTVYVHWKKLYEAKIFKKVLC